MDFCHTKYIKHSLRFASLRYASLQSLPEIPSNPPPPKTHTTPPLTMEILSPVRKTFPSQWKSYRLSERHPLPVSIAGQYQKPENPRFWRFFGFPAARRCGRNFLYSLCYFRGPYLCRKKRIFQIGPVLFFIKWNNRTNTQTNKHTHTHT